MTSLSAVIFVVSPHWALVTPTILSQMDRGDVGEAAALSVVLIVLVLLVIHGVPRLLGRDWREGTAAGSGASCSAVVAAPRRDRSTMCPA